QALDVRLPERRDGLDVEAREHLPEGVALAQDGDPRQPGLERLQRHPLVEPAVVGDRAAPLVVVIGEVVRRGERPRTAAVGAHRLTRSFRRTALALFPAGSTAETVSL